MAHPDLRPRWSLVGLTLAGGFLVSAWAVQGRTGASSAPVVMFVVASTAAMVAAMVLGFGHRALVPLGVALGISSIAYEWRTELFGGPLSGPFGYRNAFGALLLQGGLAWVLAGFSVRHPAARALSLIPAAVLGVLAVGSSTATAAGGALALVAALAWVGKTGARVAVVLCGVATAAVLAGTIWLGAVYDPGDPVTGLMGRIADSGVTERRLALWHDAVAIAREHPGGIGHGRFGSTSPTARDDRDTIHAHNEFLEQGAELGWVGMTLAMLIVGWAFGRLAICPRADAVTALSAVSLAGLTIHASVDYVLHFPVVPILAAALVGTGIAQRARDQDGRVVEPDSRMRLSPAVTE